MTREEQLACLKDRPCDVCKMRTDKGCSSWECVFEQTPDEEKEPCDCIIRANVEKIKEIMTDINGDSVYVARMKDIRALPSIQPTTKENLVVEDCISREEVCDYIAEFVNHEYATDRERELVKNIIGGIQHLPSIRSKTDVLDKIRAEIHATAEMHEDGDYYLRDEWIDEIIDKYTAESEDKE